MACVLTQDLALDCLQSMGGIETLYAVELAAKAAITTDASGKITAFTLNSTKEFFEYDLRKEDALWETTDTPNEQNGSLFFEQSVTFSVFEMTTTKRAELLLLKRAKSLIMVKDNNGRYWLLGEIHGMDYSAGTTGTGQASGDKNGYTITLMGKEANPAKEVDSGLIAALTAPAA